MDLECKEDKANVVEFRIDSKYEFSAPHYFDFSKGETEEEAAAAEMWFRPNFSYAASPLVGKVKSVSELSKGCNLEEYIAVQKLVARVSPEVPDKGLIEATSSPTCEVTCTALKDMAISLVVQVQTSPAAKEDPCTPRDQVSQHFVELKSAKQDHSAVNLPVKQNHSDVHKLAVNASTTGRNSQLPVPSGKRNAAKRCLAPCQKMDLSDTRQANKRQKLEGGRSCQIWDKKPALPPPKHLPVLTIPQEFHFNTEKRAQIYKETGQCSSVTRVNCSNSPFKSIAEMVQKFQLNISGSFHPQPSIQGKAAGRRLRLTHPKEPMLGTSLRARPPTVKSFAEQEEELLANLPKFKARPLNKRILEGPTLPMLPRSTPQLPEFQTFNLRTMERALMHQPPLSSMEVSNLRGRCVTSNGEFHLHTAARARPCKMKSTSEMEQEELARMPKFKARPVNKRIFSSRGDVGIFPVPKRQATVPKEFHFATDERAQYHSAIMELGNKVEPAPYRIQLNNRYLKERGEYQERRCKTNDWMQSSGVLFEKEHSVEGRAPIEADRNDIHDHPQPALHTYDVTMSQPRVRKPLMEIQQFGFGADAQIVPQEQVNRKYLERLKVSDYEPQPTAQCYSLAARAKFGPFCYAENTAVYPSKPSFQPRLIQEQVLSRVTMELIPNKSPNHLLGSNAAHVQQHLSFPVYHMR